MNQRWLRVVGAIALFVIIFWVSQKVRINEDSSPPQPIQASLPQSTPVSSVPAAGSAAKNIEQSLTPVTVRRPRVHPSEITQMMRDDRLCDFVRTSAGKGTQALAWQQLMEGTDVYDLLGHDGPLNGMPNYGNRSGLVILFNALLFSGMLEGVRGPAIDHYYADQLFRQLEASDPSNGEIFYLHAYQASLAGRPASEQHELMMKAVYSDYYASAMGHVVEFFKNNRPDNATGWYAMIDFLTTIPIPSYPPPAFVHKLMHDDPPEVHARVVHFGESMMNNSQHIKIERIFGMRMVQDFWEAAYPDKPKPSLQDPMADLFAAIQSGAKMPTIDSDHCDRKEWDDYYAIVDGEAYDF